MLSAARLDWYQPGGEGQQSREGGAVCVCMWRGMEERVVSAVLLASGSCRNSEQLKKYVLEGCFPLPAPPRLTAATIQIFKYTSNCLAE